MGDYKDYKNRVFTRKPTKKFVSFLFNHVFGHFSVRGVKKHDNKMQKKSDPDPFLASDPPTHHGGFRFLFAAPWQALGAQARARYFVMVFSNSPRHKRPKNVIKKK
jgi:hypothetical protein